MEVNPSHNIKVTQIVYDDRYIGKWGLISKILD